MYYIKSCYSCLSATYYDSTWVFVKVTLNKIHTWPFATWFPSKPAFFKVFRSQVLVLPWWVKGILAYSICTHSPKILVYVAHTTKMSLLQGIWDERLNPYIMVLTGNAGWTVLDRTKPSWNLLTVETIVNCRKERVGTSMMSLASCGYNIGC